MATNPQKPATYTVVVQNTFYIATPQLKYSPQKKNFPQKIVPEKTFRGKNPQFFFFLAKTGGWQYKTCFALA